MFLDSYITNCSFLQFQMQFFAVLTANALNLMMNNKKKECATANVAHSL